MIAVIFEVDVKPGQGANYFDLAADLRPELEKIDGFISVERFQSLATPDRYLSLSIWRDHEAVENWHKNQRHVIAQKKGQTKIFSGYRIRVSEVIRDYTIDTSLI